MRLLLAFALVGSLFGCSSPKKTTAPDTDAGHGGIALDNYGQARPPITGHPQPDSTPRPNAAAAARDLYLQGYVLREAQPNEARALFKRVLTMTREGDEIHEKAKRQLEALAPP